MNSKFKTAIIVVLIILILAIIGLVVYFLIRANAPADFVPGQSCDMNTYNCGDFQSQEGAQSMFDLCGGVENDIHGLDKDGNGIACESLS